MADEKIIASYPPYVVGVLRCVKDWQLKSSDFSAVQGSMGESSGTLQRVSFVVTRSTVPYLQSTRYISMHDGPTEVCLYIIIILPLLRTFLLPLHKTLSIIYKIGAAWHGDIALAGVFLMTRLTILILQHGPETILTAVVE